MTTTNAILEYLQSKQATNKNTAIKTLEIANFLQKDRSTIQKALKKLSQIEVFTLREGRSDIAYVYLKSNVLEDQLQNTIVEKHSIDLALGEEKHKHFLKQKESDKELLSQKDTIHDLTTKLTSLEQELSSLKQENESLKQQVTLQNINAGDTSNFNVLSLITDNNRDEITNIFRLAMKEYNNQQIGAGWRNPVAEKLSLIAFLSTRKEIFTYFHQLGFLIPGAAKDRWVVKLP